MKLCCEGPLVQADPQNSLYVRVTAENAPSLVAALKGGTPRSNKPIPRPRFSNGKCSIVLANSGVIDPERIESYIAADGYQALHEVLHEMTPKDVVAAMVQERLARSRRRGLSHRAEMGHGRQIAGRQEIRHLQRG
jgi:bidirectional [NiFe] hydrogenase diaphorase subunit